MTMPQRYKQPLIYKPPCDPLQILFQDEHIIVAEKPSGLLSVPGRAADHADCLESRIKTENPEARIIHRLDMDTSGVMVLAMNAQAHRDISKQFENRAVKKAYIARVWGILEEKEGQVNLPLRCDWPNRPMQIVDHEQGRDAVTDWKILESEDNVTTLRLFPLTGRTHQLRVHMLALGHPILGDDLYAHEAAYQAADRLQLHAEYLEFTHPDTQKTVKFLAPPPFGAKIEPYTPYK